ncbi:FadR/GntR family transcriptional regulator [Bosea sp. RCC_152_1]|uniref:FadR/GntR family transcriptional regulator n=1 Tax=Bosea sp. RCC_152_1 TaxID=3239228 RepID=UPI003523D196
MDKIDRDEHHVPSVRMKRGDAQWVRAELERALRSDRWMDGEKLPTERDLGEQYGVARNTVRRALDGLEEAGLVIRHIGRGTFKRAVEAQQMTEAPIADHFSPAEVVECRMVFEPALADLVVARATQADIDRLRNCLQGGDAAHELMAFEHWDAEFHDAIALATHNAPAIAMSRMLAQVRRNTEWGQLKAKGAVPERMELLKKQHHAIFEAFASRDSAKASTLLYDHVVFIQDYMFGVRRKI